MVRIICSYILTLQFHLITLYPENIFVMSLCFLVSLFSKFSSKLYRLQRYRLNMMKWRQNFLRREQHLKLNTRSYISLFIPRCDAYPVFLVIYRISVSILISAQCMQRYEIVNGVGENESSATEQSDKDDDGIYWYMFIFFKQNLLAQTLNFCREGSSWFLA